MVDFLHFRVLVGKFADVAGLRGLELGELALVLLDGRAVGDGDTGGVELGVDALEAGLGRLKVELVLGLGLVDDVELFRDLLHLVVGRVHLVLGLILLEFVLGLRELVLGIREALLEEFARVLLLFVAQVRQALDEALHEHLIGLLGLLWGLARYGNLQDFSVFVGLGDNMALDVGFVGRQLAIFVGLFGRFDDRQDDVAALENFGIGHHALFVARGVAGRQAREDGIAEAFLLLDAQQGVGLIDGVRDEEIRAARGHEGSGNGRDFLLVGHDDLRELSEVNGYFFQTVRSSLLVVQIILRFRDQVDAAEDWRDVAGKVDAVVARHVEQVPFTHDVVLGHIARAQHVVEVDLDERLRLVLMDEVDFLLGRVAREAFGRTDGVDDRMRLLELDGAGLLDLAEDVDAHAAELRDVDRDVGVDDVAREAIRQRVRELTDGHALGVNLADERERDVAVGAHGERRLVGRGIAEVLLLSHDDIELVAGAQQIVLGCHGRGFRARGRGLYLLDDVGLLEFFLLLGLCLAHGLLSGLYSLRDIHSLRVLHGCGRGHIGGDAAGIFINRCSENFGGAEGQTDGQREHGLLYQDTFTS